MRAAPSSHRFGSGKTGSAGTKRQKQAPDCAGIVPKRRSIVNDNSIKPIGTYKRRDRSPNKPRRASLSDTAGGLTRRQYQILLLLSVYGWCTPRILQSIAKYYGLPCERVWLGEILGLLLKARYIIANKVLNGTREMAYAVSKAGLSALYGSETDSIVGADVTRDPANVSHLLGVNRTFVGFLQAFAVNYWMSNSQVRADNLLYGKAGLAKDYDAVAEILVQNTPVRIGIEYELTVKSSARYAEFCPAYAAERHLHLVIYVLGEGGMLSAIAPHFREAGGIICFISSGDFLVSRAQATAHYWNNGELRSGPLGEIVKYVSKRARPVYTPANQVRAANFTCS